MRHPSRVVKTRVVKFRNPEFKISLWRQPAWKEPTDRPQFLLLRFLYTCMFVSFVPLGLKCFSREESVNYVCVSSLPFHLISTRMLWLGEGCCFIACYNPSSHLFVCFFCNRNAVPFTATQVEAIRAGMQPGLTMVGFIFLNSLLDAKTTIEVYFATLL